MDHLTDSADTTAFSELSDSAFAALTTPMQGHDDDPDLLDLQNLQDPPDIQQRTSMSFQQGLSGLNATARNLQVIGNNIANANTVGAKAARAEFGDVYAASLNGAGVHSVGAGVSVIGVIQQFTQGTIRSTENPIDMAINGPGFFQTRDTHGLVTYTRNGQFQLDREGFLSNSTGQHLMGYPVDYTGTVQPGRAVPLQLPTAGVPPHASTRVVAELNLDSRLAVTAPASGPAINFADASTYNNATSMTAYDSRGQEVALTYYFQRSGPAAWNVFVTANGTPVNGTAAAPTPLTTITFAADGSAPTAPTAPVAFDVPASSNSVGAPTQPITGVLFDLRRATQFGSQFGVTNLSQDGYSAGTLASIAVENNGIIMGRYTNGQTRPAGQVEIATFRNPQGLQPLGDNAWARSYSSGDAVVGVPGDGNLGLLQSGALEESNVDLTSELVSMITAQRIYQANAQTIKTEDQILQTLVNLR